MAEKRAATDELVKEFDLSEVADSADLLMPSVSQEGPKRQRRSESVALLSTESPLKGSLRRGATQGLLEIGNSITGSDSVLDSDNEFEEAGSSWAPTTHSFPDLSGNDVVDTIINRKQFKETLNFEQFIDTIPLDDKAPVGHTRRRLVRKKDLDAEMGVTDSDENNIDTAFEDETVDEEAIELDRAKIEAAAKRFNCRPKVVTLRRKEEIIADERGEAIANPELDSPSRQRLVAPMHDRPRRSLLDLGRESSVDDEMEVVSEDQLGRVDNQRKFREVVEEKVRWRVGGMRTPLLDHQVLGVDWMIGQEMSVKQPRGGLVADAMGLGKTIQAIATMMVNLPPEDNEAQVTLIVAPVALLRQWRDEIMTHCKRDAFDVFINHGLNKIKKLKDLKSRDVVITTYASVMYSCPKTKPPPGINREDYASWFEDEFEEHRGIFHRMKFWRVILDESHIIKNRRSRTSIACQRLEAEHTWCLTGTPIQNTLYDLYPMFNFIRHPFHGILDNYKAMIERRSPAEAAKCVQVVLRNCHMRRTKNEILVGKRLITLPKKRVRIVELEFDQEERALYMAVEERSRDVINSFIRKGTHAKNYNHILTMLLRLRQICNHPYLILTMITKDFNADDLDRALNMEYQEDELDMKEFVHDKKKSGLQRLLEAAKQVPVGDDISKCTICATHVEEPVMARCRHVFCKQCIQNAVAEDTQQGKNTFCPNCGHEIEDSELKATQVKVPEEESGAWLENVGEFMYSAKSYALKDQLSEWRMNHPKDKIILFSQFTKMLDITERVLEDCNLDYCRYDGRMTINEREESLARFRADPDARIMLTSIKAGGVGLNLTIANLVISMDLWWNAATEMQAFDRVHRLGQEKEVYVTRFLIKDTVEQRILDKQKTKLALADAALGEGDAKLGTLSVNQLMGLFGNLVRKDGQMQLEADYDRRQVMRHAREAGERRAVRHAIQHGEVDPLRQMTAHTTTFFC